MKRRKVFNCNWLLQNKDFDEARWVLAILRPLHLNPVCGYRTMREVMQELNVGIPPLEALDIFERDFYARTSHSQAKALDDKCSAS